MMLLVFSTLLLYAGYTFYILSMILAAGDRKSVNRTNSTEQNRACT